jgi:hypothetical protein
VSFSLIISLYPHALRPYAHTHAHVRTCTYAYARVTKERGSAACGTLRLCARHLCRRHGGQSTRRRRQLNHNATLHGHTPPTLPSSPSPPSPHSPVASAQPPYHAAGTTSEDGQALHTMLQAPHRRAVKPSTPCCRHHIGGRSSPPHHAAGTTSEGGQAGPNNNAAVRPGTKPLQRGPSAQDRHRRRALPAARRKVGIGRRARKGMMRQTGSYSTATRHIWAIWLITWPILAPAPYIPLPKSPGSWPPHFSTVFVRKRAFDF